MQTEAAGADRPADRAGGARDTHDHVAETQAVGSPSIDAPAMPSPCRLLVLVLVLAGCAAAGPVVPTQPAEEAVRSAQAAANAARLAAAQGRAAQEPRYLRFKADETQLAAVWDDGRHTYLEFAVPARADLEFFDEEGRPIATATAGRVAAVQGLHAGILIRSADRVSFVSPNPRALSLPRAALPAGADFGEARAKLENQSGQLQAMQRAMEAAGRVERARAAAAPLPPWVMQAQPAVVRPQLSLENPAPLPYLPSSVQNGQAPLRHVLQPLRQLQREAGNLPDSPPPRGPGLAPLAFANASASAPERGLVRVFFATASRAIVAPEDGLGLLLQEAAKADEIRITGFTDATGSREANAVLALARADAVVQVLLRRGIAPERILSRAVGADEYIADNLSDRGRALNRRVEILLLKDGQPLAFGAARPAR